MGQPRDVLLVNARVLTMQPANPSGEAIAIRGDRIIDVGRRAAMAALVDSRVHVVDAQGGLATPAFHDAHLHLRSWARTRSWLDVRATRSIAEIQGLLRQRAAQQPTGTWIRAWGYDQDRFPDATHPARDDLDAAAPEHLVRLQHRSMHLDVLNSAALDALELSARAASIEREPNGLRPTGRVFNAGELLRSVPPSRANLAADVRLASDQLLAWGITSVQDASATNGLREWDLFRALADDGALRVRVFMLPGIDHAGEFAERLPGSGAVRLGPLKVMLDEATSQPDELRQRVFAARTDGWPVAIHATSEAEIALALDVLRDLPRAPLRDRLEHAAVVPDALLPDLSAAGVTVVGQPTLVYERGDVYVSEFPPEHHGWLHRARTYLAAGIPYAIGSDAPVTDPQPGRAIRAARQRLTRGGRVLGPQEQLDTEDALRALTLGPSQAVGADAELGSLRPGSLADIVVLDPRCPERPAWITIMNGQVVWTARQLAQSSS